MATGCRRVRSAAARTSSRLKSSITMTIACRCRGGICDWSRSTRGRRWPWTAVTSINLRGQNAAFDEDDTRAGLLGFSLGRAALGVGGLVTADGATIATGTAGCRCGRRRSSRWSHARRARHYAPPRGSLQGRPRALRGRLPHVLLRMVEDRQSGGGRCMLVSQPPVACACRLLPMALQGGVLGRRRQWRHAC